MSQENSSWQEQAEKEIAQKAILAVFSEKQKQLNALQEELKQLENEIGADVLAKRKKLQIRVRQLQEKKELAERMVSGIKVKGKGDELKLREATRKAAQEFLLQVNAELQADLNELHSLETKIGEDHLERKKELFEKIWHLKQELSCVESTAKSLVSAHGAGGTSCVI